MRQKILLIKLWEVVLCKLSITYLAVILQKKFLGALSRVIRPLEMTVLTELRCLVTSNTSIFSTNQWEKGEGRWLIDGDPWGRLSGEGTFFMCRWKKKHLYTQRACKPSSQIETILSTHVYSVSYRLINNPVSLSGYFEAKPESYKSTLISRVYFTVFIEPK